MGISKLQGILSESQVTKTIVNCGTCKKQLTQNKEVKGTSGDVWYLKKK